MVRSTRKLARLEPGHIETKPATFSSGWVRDVAGTYQPISDDDIVQRAKAITEKRLMRGPALLNPATVHDFLALRLSGLEHEVFGMILLDNRHKVIAVEELFRGTVDGATVHTRECVKTALKNNAAALVLYHNHPSGEAAASQADELITRRICEAMSLIEVRVLDHIITGGATTVSFAERGLL